MDLKIIAFIGIEFMVLVIPSMTAWTCCIQGRKPSAFPTMYVVLPTVIGETLRVKYMMCQVRGTIVSFWHVNFCRSCIPSSLLIPWCALHSPNSCHWSAISSAHVLVFSMIHRVCKFQNPEQNNFLILCVPVNLAYLPPDSFSMAADSEFTTNKSIQT